MITTPFLSDARIVPVDQNLLSWEPGFSINGIAIDNNTGNWLRISAGNMAGDFFVPPFCYGWQQKVVGARSLTMRVWPGPATLPSVAGEGDAVKVFATAETLRTSIGYTSQIATAVINNLESSFDTEVLTTVVAVSNTPVLLPAVALAGRSAVLLQSAPDNTFTIFVGGATVTADEASTGGIQMLPGMSLPIDADANALIYGVCKSTQFGNMIVMEAY